MASIFNRRKAKYKPGPIRPSETRSSKLSAAKRRIAKSGYPRAEKLQTVEEVSDYFSRPTITCLICGNEYKWLSHTHLGYIHSMSPDEYRDKFGLPRNKGLCGTDFSSYQRERFETNRKRMAKGENPGTLHKSQGRPKNRILQPYELDRMRKQYETLVGRDADGKLKRK